MLWIHFLCLNEGVVKRGVPEPERVYIGDLPIYTFLYQPIPISDADFSFADHVFNICRNSFIHLHYFMWI